MKTAVSIPDPIFEQAEALTRRLGTSRSQLYSHAVAEYLTRHDPATVTDRLNAVVDAISEPEDRFITETARSVLERVRW